jgi:hypothetical protein
LNERVMDKILLVIRGQGINDDIDSGLEGRRPLGFATGRAFMHPLAELVPFPGPRQVILAIDDRRPVVQDDPFEKGIYFLPSPNAIDEIKTPIYGVVGRKSLERMVRKDFLDLPVEGPVKSEPFGPHGILCEQEASMIQESPQNLPLLDREGLKLVPACYVKEGTEKEIRFVQADYASLWQGLNTGPQLQLLHDGLKKLRVGVPFSAAIFYLGKKELSEGSALRELQSGEKQSPCQGQS